MKETHKAWAVVMEPRNPNNKAKPRFAPNIDTPSPVPVLFGTESEALRDCRNNEKPVAVIVTIESLPEST